MASIRFLPYPKFQAFDNNGAPLSGGKVNVYAAGTSTRITTWADSEKSGTNTNPVILNARGEADIWFDVPAKIVLTDADDVQIWSEDNISPLNAQTVTGRFNLVENGSFELDGDGDGEPDSWTISLFNSGTSTVEIDTSNIVDGTNSLKFVSQGDGGGTATSNRFEVPDGADIGVSFYIRSTVADVRNIVRVQYYDKNGASTSSTTLYDDSSTNPTSFTLKAFGTAVPAGSTQAELILIGCDSSDPTSGTTYYDFAQVTNQGYIFSGTPGEVTASAAELNVLDGVTATTTELNRLDVDNVDYIGSYFTKKSSDQTLTNTTTLTDATDMELDLPVGIFKLSISANSVGGVGSDGIEVQLDDGTATVAGTISNGIFLSDEDGANQIVTSYQWGGTVSVTLTTGGTWEIGLHWEMHIHVTSAGTIKMQFAQNSSSGDTCTLLKDSTMVAHKIN